MTEPVRSQPQAGTPPRRTGLLVVFAALVLVLAAGAALGGYLVVGRMFAPGPAARVKDGIKAPDPRCVDDVQDVTHPWVRDGWWAGRVDGVPREMTSQEAAAMSIAGHQMEGVWLCPPHR